MLGMKSVMAGGVSPFAMACGNPGRRERSDIVEASRQRPEAGANRGPTPPLAGC